MDRILKVLVVGVGGRGWWPLAYCRPELGFQIVALCDMDTALAERAAARAGLGVTRCFDDADVAIAESGADCMIICAPSQLHVEFSKKGIDAGMAVLTEKPMGHTWEQCLDIVEHARKKKGVLCVAQNYRYTAMQRMIRDAIQDENSPHFLGHVFMVDYRQHRFRPEPGNVTFPHGAVWSMSCHHFDDLYFWFGPVAEITAHEFAAPWSRYPYANNNSAFIRMANGTVVNYCHTHDAVRQGGCLEFHGERGALVITDHGEFSRRRQSGAEKFEVIPADWEPVEGEGEKGVLRDFYEYAVNGTEPGISGYNNLEIMAMCQMAILSGEGSRTVRREELG